MGERFASDPETIGVESGVVLTEHLTQVLDEVALVVRGPSTADRLSYCDVVLFGHDVRLDHQAKHRLKRHDDVY